MATAVSLAVQNLTKEALELGEPYYEALRAFASGEAKMIATEPLEVLTSYGLIGWQMDEYFVTPKGHHVLHLIRAAREVEVALGINAVQEQWQRLNHLLNRLDELLAEDDPRNTALEAVLTLADDFQSSVERLTRSTPSEQA